MLIPLWQRGLGILIYMLPWSDAIPFGRHLFLEFPWLQWISLPALPIFFLERGIPFGSLLIFFLLFLGVTRNPKIPYFLRFNTLQALLLDIGLIVISYAFQILLGPFSADLIPRALSSTVLVGVLTIIVFTTIECFQGKEPDLPGISQAVRIQLY